MRICFLNDSIARLGGLERIWSEKMNILAENYDIDVYLVTICQGTHPFAFPISSKIHHIDLGIFTHHIYRHTQPIRSLLKLRIEHSIRKEINKVVKQIHPDIITVTSYEAHTCISNLKYNAKIVVESHVAESFTLKDGVRRSVISNIYQKYHNFKNIQTIKKRSDVIVALTHNDAKNWKTKNVVVIPNIVDLHNTEHSQLKEKTAIFAGRFTYQKGLDRMLNAWKIIVTKRKDWTLKLVGEGELKEFLEHRCQELEITDRVIFKQATNEIKKEYINSSLLLFTSRFEGFGLILVEAMQCGVPCISFDCPYGPSDIIDNGVNGYLVENGNVEDFAVEILKLINDDELRIKMGKAAIEKAKKYLPENIMPLWIKLYEDLLTK